jgi:hypothetical protein
VLASAGAAIFLLTVPETREQKARPTEGLLSPLAQGSC